MDTFRLQSKFDTLLGRHRVPVLAALCILLLLLGLFAVRSTRTNAQAAAAPPPPLPVEALAISSQPLPLTLDSIGNLRAVRQVTLTAEVPGRVTRILFASGANVSQGQLLVQLNDGPERASQRSFNVSAELASIQLARASELVELGAEAQQTIDQHRAERDHARAEIRRIGATVMQKRINAPFAGTLGIRRVDLGQYLNPGDPIATLTDLSQIYVEFQVPQKYFANLSRGSTVTVTTDSWPGKRFVGRLETIETQVSEDTRNFVVQALIENRSGALRPGMYVDARLELGLRKDTLTVPASAVLPSAQGESVVVVDKPDKRGIGTVRFAPVKTGDRVGDDVVILEGLRSGEMVVTTGQLRLRPDMSVRIVKPKARATSKPVQADGA